MQRVCCQVVVLFVAGCTVHACPLNRMVTTMACGVPVGWHRGTSQALAISNSLREKGCYPKSVKDPKDIAEFFFEACAIETSAQQLATIAATMARNGIANTPVATGSSTTASTTTTCYSPEESRALLSMLYSCGMSSVRGRRRLCCPD